MLATRAAANPRCYTGDCAYGMHSSMACRCRFRDRPTHLDRRSDHRVEPRRSAPRLASTLDSVSFRDLPEYRSRTGRICPRIVLARLGNATTARAMLERYRVEVTDTALRRDATAAMHTALGEIAFAEHRPTRRWPNFTAVILDTTANQRTNARPASRSILVVHSMPRNRPDSAIAIFRAVSLHAVLEEDGRR